MFIFYTRRPWPRLLFIILKHYMKFLFHLSKQLILTYSSEILILIPWEETDAESLESESTAGVSLCGQVWQTQAGCRTVDGYPTRHQHAAQGLGRTV
jgi:hypothetical protein